MEDFNNLINNHTLFTRHTSQPINTYVNNPADAKKYYRGLTSNTHGRQERYNLHYDVLANQDIAFDLQHVAFLTDREIYVNKYKDACVGLSAEFASDRNYDVSQQGLFLKTENYFKRDASYQFLFETKDEERHAATSVLSKIDDNDNNYLIFNTIPQGFPNYGSTTYNKHLIPQLYKSIFSVGDNIDVGISEINPSITEISYNDISYNVEWIVGISDETYLNFDLSLTGFNPIENDILWPTASGWQWSSNHVEEHQVLNGRNNETSWNIIKIERGVVYASYNSQTPTDFSYIMGFTNIYEKTNFNENLDLNNVDVQDVYWIDEPRSWFDGHGQDAIFDCSLHAQIPLVDLSFNNSSTNTQEIYTIKNALLGFGGFASLLDIDSNNFTDTTITYNDVSSSNFYTLSPRYDITSTMTQTMIQSNYLNTFYDKLYYDHSWTRHLTGDVSATFIPISSTSTILHTDLTDTIMTNSDVKFNRNIFTYDFPYLFYKYNDIADSKLIRDIKNSYNLNLWDDLSFNDLSGSGIAFDKSSLPADINFMTDRSLGYYDFVFDLKKCSVLYEAANYKITNSETKLCKITNLGQHIKEDEVKVRGYFYGKYNENGKSYFVFKYKEPAAYTYNPDVSNALDYRLFEPDSTYNNRLPKGGDKYRNYFGMRTDYNTTAHMTIHPEITGMDYIPIKVNFENSVNIDSIDLSYSPISNGTGVFLLKVNCLRNDAIYKSTIFKSGYNYYQDINPALYYNIDIPLHRNTISSMWSYYSRTKLKPTRFLIDYSGNNTEKNIGLIDSDALINQQNINMYLPLSGDRENGSWMRGKVTYAAKEPIAYREYVEDGNIKQTYLQSYLIPPIACCHGSKVHNTIYDYSSNEIPILTDIEFSNLIDPNDSSSNIFDAATDVNNRYFLSNGKYNVIINPATLGALKNYVIPVRTLLQSGTNIRRDTEEYLINLNLVINNMTPFLTNNLHIKVLDNEQNETFDIPYYPNPNYYLGEPQKSDISFVLRDTIICGDVSMNIGSIEPNKIKFAGSKILEDISNQPYNPIINRLEEVEFDILYQGQTYYTSLRNTLTFEVNNGYSYPRLFQNNTEGEIVFDVNIHDIDSEGNSKTAFNIVPYYRVDELYNNVHIDISTNDLTKITYAQDVSSIYATPFGKVELHPYSEQDMCRNIVIIFDQDQRNKINLRSGDIKRTNIDLLMFSTDPPYGLTPERTKTIKPIKIRFNVENRAPGDISTKIFNINDAGNEINIINGEINYPPNTMNFYIVTWMSSSIDFDVQYLNDITTITSVTFSKVTMANGWTFNNPNSESKREFVTDYEICECVPKTIHKEIGPNGAQTMAEYLSNRARNMHFQPRKITRMVMNSDKKTAQNDRAITKLRNF